MLKLTDLQLFKTTKSWQSATIRLNEQSALLLHFLPVAPDCSLLWQVWTRNINRLCTGLWLTKLGEMAMTQFKPVYQNHNDSHKRSLHRYDTEQMGFKDCNSCHNFTSLELDIVAMSQRMGAFYGCRLKHFVSSL